MVAPPLTIRRAKNLRRKMSLPEVLLWRAVRADATGVRLRRQHPIGPYILDFFCTESRLAIEIDGASHGGDDAQQYDDRRDAWLVGQGVRMLRISARHVLSDMDAVLRTIEAARSGAIGGRV
jgi:very-short-patch-repair endonuclease